MQTRLHDNTKTDKMMLWTDRSTDGVETTPEQARHKEGLMMQKSDEEADGLVRLMTGQMCMVYKVRKGDGDEGNRRARQGAQGLDSAASGCSGCDIRRAEVRRTGRSGRA